MSNLYDRLDEIQGLRNIFVDDVQRLRSRLGPRLPAEIDGEIAGVRRAYVRAVFALVEALAEQHKRLLLDLAEHGSVELSAGVAQGLAERVYVVQDDGTVRQREQYLPLRRKIRAVYRAAGDAFGHQVNVRYDDQGWQQFNIATAVRDRITHPKSFLECNIGVEELDTIDCAEGWFRGVYNEFVRVAREHRATHEW